ncbi:Uncharacterized protein Fot_24351 [Forsythia ovata]|uniref:Uncharacterized protein n=1 Tax=Forsythia ovata TaxID=205694 RepID=A0ABD1U720_9LAMI
MSRRSSRGNQLKSLQQLLLDRRLGKILCPIVPRAEADCCKGIGGPVHVLIEEVEIRVRDLELTKRNADTTICNVDKIIKDRDHFQERATWLQGSLNGSKNEEKLLAEERDKLKKDLQNAESDVAKFSKRYDHATHAKAVTAKALEEANNQRKGLVDKVAKFEDALDSLKVECSALKEANLKLEKGTEEMVKAGVENFRNQFEFTHDYENLQAFFVNFRARQVLSKLKELHPNPDLSEFEADYPAPREV